MLGATPSTPSPQICISEELSFPQAASQCLQFRTNLLLGWGSLICKWSSEWKWPMYLYPLAGVPPAFRKVNKAEPTSTSTCNIPGFEISMSYSDMMKVLYQHIQLKSARKLLIINESNLLWHDFYCLLLRFTQLPPIIQNATTWDQPHRYLWMHHSGGEWYDNVVDKIGMLSPR